MSKFINRFKFLLTVIVVMAFLPLPNLFADWDWYWDSDLGPYDYDYTNTSHMILIKYCTYGGDEPYNDESGGFYIGNWFYVYTDADIWSLGDQYSDDADITGVVDVSAQKDWEWDGPPATAPGADVDIDLGLYGYHDFEIGLWDPNDEADLSADGGSITGGYAQVWDSQDYDANCVLGYVIGEADGSDYSLAHYMWGHDPDNKDWDPDENNGPDSVKATLEWDYSSSIEYEVSSGLGWFSADASGEAFAHSDVSIDTDATEHGETWSVQDAYTEIYCVCDMTSN